MRRPIEGLSLHDIAAVAHEANRQLQRITGEIVNFPWESTSQSLRDSAIDGVGAHLQSDLTPEESHKNWLEYKAAEGWVYGPNKDADAKTHPCMVPYEELPTLQRAKDSLFRSVVLALSEVAD